MPDGGMPDQIALLQAQVAELQAQVLELSGLLVVVTNKLAAVEAKAHWHYFPRCAQSTKEAV